MKVSLNLTGVYCCKIYLFSSSRAREKVNDVNFWMKRFLMNIGILIEEDGEDVLPTTMQPVSMEDFNSYLSP